MEGFFFLRFCLVGVFLFLQYRVLRFRGRSFAFFFVASHLFHNGYFSSTFLRDILKWMCSGDAEASPFCFPLIAFPYFRLPEVGIKGDWPNPLMVPGSIVSVFCFHGRWYHIGCQSGQSSVGKNSPTLPKFSSDIRQPLSSYSFILPCSLLTLAPSTPAPDFFICAWLASSILQRPVPWSSSKNSP